MRETVHLCEVSPRDGLQNESTQLSLEHKEELVAGLLEAGLHQIEIGSFVNPKAVPAMADTDQLNRRVKQSFGSRIRTLGLIMNEKGFDRALEAGVDGVCIVTVVSNSLCLKNNRCRAEEAHQTAVKLLRRAKDHGLYARVDIATAWVCPYEGQISQDAVLRCADQIWDGQPDELAFCDSIGYAEPFQVARLFELAGERYDRTRLVAHFHDTQAMGLANAAAALAQGVRRFDVSLGGLGGCPFAPGAKGNLASEDLVHLCEKAGFTTGVDMNKLWATLAILEQRMRRPLGGRVRSFYRSQTHVQLEQAL